MNPFVCGIVLTMGVMGGAIARPSERAVPVFAVAAEAIAALNAPLPDSEKERLARVAAARMFALSLVSVGYLVLSLVPSVAIVTVLQLLQPSAANSVIHFMTSWPGMLFALLSAFVPSLLSAVFRI